MKLRQLPYVRSVGCAQNRGMTISPTPRDAADAVAAKLSSTGAIGAVVPIANDDNARLVFQAV